MKGLGRILQAYVQLIPSMTGFADAASQALLDLPTGPAEKAGDKQGRAYSKALGNAANKSLSSSIGTGFVKAMEKASQLAIKSSSSILTKGLSKMAPKLTQGLSKNVMQPIRGAMAEFSRGWNSSPAWKNLVGEVTKRSTAISSFAEKWRLPLLRAGIQVRSFGYMFENQLGGVGKAIAKFSKNPINQFKGIFTKDIGPQLASGIGSFLSGSGSLIAGGLSAAFRGATAVVGTSLRAISGIATRVTSSAVSSLMSIARTATLVGAGITTVLAGIAVKGGFTRVMDIEQATAKLTGLGHSTEEVENIMASALASVKGTAFGLGEAATVAATAVAAGVKPGDELQRNLRLVADAATIAGVDMASMGSIFNKVAASDKIMGDTINQLHDAGIPVLQLLARELGLTAAETADLASEGKINFETFQNAMQAGLGGAALASGQTFLGALKNLGAAVSRLTAEYIRPVTEALTPIFGQMIEMVDRFAANSSGSISSWTDAVGVAANFVSGTLLPAIDAFLGRLGSGEGSAFITNFANLIGQWVGNLIGFFNQIAPVVTQVLEQVGVFFGYFQENILPQIIGGIQEFIPMLGQLIGQFAAIIGPVLQEVIPLIAAAFQDAMPVMMAALQEFGSALAEYIPVLGRAILDLVVMLMPILVQLVPILFAILTAIANILTPLLPVITQILGALMPVISFLLQGVSLIISAVAWVLELIAQSLGWLFGGNFTMPSFNTDYYVPQLAEGATVMPKQGGTLALLAERGRAETVVDYGKMNQALDYGIQGKKENASTILNVYPSDGMDVDTFVDKVIRKLKRSGKR